MHNSQHNSSSRWNPANKGQEHSRNVVDREMKIYENIYDCLEHRVETSGSVMSFEKAEEKIDIIFVSSREDSLYAQKRKHRKTDILVRLRKKCFINILAVC